ncbi:MAG TPA: hypothetical protein VE998_06970, partial [Terriglobales bacterium]|nr:hypothetical protein [Terriglobales bacterium]
MPVRSNRSATSASAAPGRILVLDIGGTHVKILGPGRTERIAIDSGPAMTPARMVAEVKKLTAGKQYD